MSRVWSLPGPVPAASLVCAPGRKAQLALEEKLRALEEECRRKEAERVSLELELTEVTESLRKALAGGVTLGLAIEPRSGTSSPQVPPAPLTSSHAPPENTLLPPETPAQPHAAHRQQSQQLRRFI